MKIFHEIKELIDSDSSALWSEEIRVKKNDFLIQPGAIERNLYFVKEGTLRVYFIRDGHEHVFRFGYKNSFICSLDSFLNQSPSLFYVQAIKESRLISISRHSLMSYILNHNLTSKWISALSEIVSQQVLREIDILTTTPIERYERLLKRSPWVFQEIPHKYIASYLRMTPETFSRLLKS